MSDLLLEDVTKVFGTAPAVQGLSFAVQQGEVFGFLGSNGAGKTTTLRMVLDIVQPTSGTVRVLGQAPSRRTSRAIGFLPEERGLYRNMSPVETVGYFGRIKGMTASAATAEARRLLDRFGVDPAAKITVDKLSKGTGQKVQLATAIVNRPRLLLLDEPFSGLDPVNQQLLEEVIREFARSGATVLFSTHVMQHAERLCDRLLLVANGRKLFEGTQEEARAILPARLAIVCERSPHDLPDVASATWLGEEAGWSEWDIELVRGASPDALLEHCTSRGFALRRFAQHRPGLHDVFIHMVGPETGSC